MKLAARAHSKPADRAKSRADREPERSFATCTQCIVETSGEADKQSRECAKKHRRPAGDGGGGARRAVAAPRVGEAIVRRRRCTALQRWRWIRESGTYVRVNAESEEREKRRNGRDEGKAQPAGRSTRERGGEGRGAEGPRSSMLFARATALCVCLCLCLCVLCCSYGMLALMAW